MSKKKRKVWFSKIKMKLAGFSRSQALAARYARPSGNYNIILFREQKLGFSVDLTGNEEKCQTRLEKYDKSLHEDVQNRQNRALLPRKPYPPIKSE